MDRECNKCVYHTIGQCSKWKCDGTKSIRDVEIDSYNRLADIIITFVSDNESISPEEVKDFVEMLKAK